MKSKIFMVLALVGLLGLAACGDDAEPDVPPADPGAEQPAMEPGAQPEMDPEMMALLTEVQELQQRLGPVEQEAMQDPELAAELESLQEQIEAAMRAENDELFEQMEQLEADFMAAQEAGDQERQQEVGMEAQSIQAELQALQQSVLARPEIQDPIEEFEANRRALMIEIDSEAGEIIDRIEEIYAELEGR